MGRKDGVWDGMGLGIWVFFLIYLIGGFLMIRVGLMFGGKSAEHEVSIESARSILGVIDRGRYEVIPIGITKDGRIGDWEWVVGVLGGGFEYREGFGYGGDMKDFNFEGVDIIFPVLHGPYGEDGRLQGYLEWIGKRYVGCGVLSSAICMDKLMFKKVMGYHGFPVVRYEGMERWEWEEYGEGILEGLLGRIGCSYPLFIKPSGMGSSLGISRALDEQGVVEGVKKAFEYDSSILIEEGLKVREFEVALMGDLKDVEVSGVGEIIPCEDFYSYSAKYEKESEIRIPALLDQRMIKQMKEYGKSVFNRLKCIGLARVDFFLGYEHGGKIYINEVNTMPGFTSISMYPKLWEEEGLKYSDLISQLIEQGLRMGKRF